MKSIFAFTLCLFAFGSFAQEDTTVKSTESREILNFAVVENSPTLLGCDTVPKVELKQCFTQGLTKHVSQNFNYPDAARKLGIQAKIYLSFVVETDGTISNVQILRSASNKYATGNEGEKKAAKALDDEAVRVISLLKFSAPAMQRGKPVRMSFTMPINAKLS